ncbi:MAG TPA: response regulator [Patescibacteria group bacterium]|nr:response regulator [Patescibacteria group bacterium]
MIENDSLRVLIVDDEAPARWDIRRMLGKIARIEIAGEAADGLEAVEMIRKARPDVVLLDIQMPGLDGFQVIEKLGDMEGIPAVIFITAYDQYAVRAFEVHAVDYLLKPVEEERLVEAIERMRRIRQGLEQRSDLAALVRTISSGPKRIPIRQGSGHLVVSEDDILYATLASGEVVAATGRIEGATNFRSLEGLMQELTPGKFARAHRSYIVNLQRIHEITPWLSGSYRLRLGNAEGPVIPLSRAQARELRKLLKF